MSARVPKACHLVQAKRTLATTFSKRRWEALVAGRTELAFYGDTLVRAECVKWLMVHWETDGVSQHNIKSLPVGLH